LTNASVESHNGIGAEKKFVGANGATAAPHPAPESQIHRDLGYNPVACRRRDNLDDLLYRVWAGEVYYLIGISRGSTRIAVSGGLGPGNCQTGSRWMARCAPEEAWPI
jgi:hypothetical protein